MKRVSTGIFGLDELMEGGFPEGRSFLVAGATGTGKSIFGMQFIYRGASEFGEPGIYVTLDERPNLLREDMLRFGWDVRKMEEENKIEIIDGSVTKIGMPSEEQFTVQAGFDLEKLLLEIVRTARKIQAKRIVIDSIPALGLNFETENEIRNAVIKTSYILERIGVTSVLISEVAEAANVFSKYGVEEYVVDGVVLLHYLGLGTQSARTMLIRKMRATKHSEQLHPMKITDKGIKVLKASEQYSEV